LIYLELRGIGNKIPGKAFRYKNDIWMYLASTACIICNPDFITPNDAKLYHSNQSLKARAFFQFRAYLLKETPYVNTQECSDLDNIKLNLILNAKFNQGICQFLIKEPICVKQQWIALSKNDCIKQAFDDLFNGFIKQFEQDNNMNIPVVILYLIKQNIKIGSAIFFCKGFNNPLKCVPEDPLINPIKRTILYQPPPRNWE